MNFEGRTYPTVKADAAREALNILIDEACNHGAWPPQVRLITIQELAESLLENQGFVNHAACISTSAIIEVMKQDQWKSPANKRSPEWIFSGFTIFEEEELHLR